jgi:hypothetical protein
MTTPLLGSANPSDYTTMDSLASDAVKSRVVVHLATGDVEVVTLTDGTLLVDGDRVEQIPVTQSISLKEVHRNASQ